MRLKPKESVLEFLSCPTPAAWIEKAEKNLDLLLIDHAHCEKKAASSAIALISLYPHETSLLPILSCLAREEMRHFELVLKVLNSRNIHFRALPAGRYAKKLREAQRQTDQARLIDALLVAALIEARSCERFSALQIILPPELKTFYAKLCQAEARHFQTYLQLAQEIAKQDLTLRLKELKEIEKNLIFTEDPEFRFHSGIPIPGNKNQPEKAYLIYN